MRNKYFRSLVTVDDFKQKVSNTLGYTSSPTPPGDQWTYLTSEKSAYINNSTKKGYATISLGRLYIGDIIEIEAEVLNESGSKAKLIVDGSTPGLSTIVSKKQGVYERVYLQYVVTSEDNYSAVCGILTAEVGKIKIRNLSVQVHTVKERCQSQIRKATIYTTATGIYALKTSKRYDPCTITVSGVDLTVSFLEPLQEEGMPFLGQEWYGNSKKYLFRVSSATTTSVILRCFDLTSADPTAALDLATLPTATYINLMLIS